MKKTKRIIAVLISALMLLSALSSLALCFAAAPDGDHEAVLGREFIDYQPIPLLVIKVNFETDGDGKDCYEVRGEDGVSRPLAFDKLYKKDSPQYGEQYCYSPDSYWEETCFGEERGSLNDYYKYISNGRFFWKPVEETSGTANDGVITVTVNCKHPGTTDPKGLADGNERRLAVEAADQYVDFSKYDKDGSGDIDFTELSIVYIYGGCEISYNTQPTVQYSFSTHAHVSSVTFGGLTLDGVGVWSKGSHRYVRMGESGGVSWSKMGKLAHELGHVLNAKDLYTDAQSWIGGCGNLSLMGSGSGGSRAGISSPTVLDPYYKVLYGFADETVASAETKEYTLFSHESTKGEFNVIRVNTLNPREYLLIENRTHSETGYDNNGLNGDMQGILIWHIDERIINSTARPNNGDEGHAAGFTIISPNNNVQDVDAGSTWSSTSVSNVFVANSTAEYKFPVSNADKNPGTWYTSMTEEQAAKCNIKIEFLSEPGHEMKIRISGANELAAEFNAGDAERTQTSMKIAANIKDYNGAAVENCKIYFADNQAMTGAKEVTAEKVSSGTYSAFFDGLTESTEYYYRVEVTTAYGTSSVSGSAFTSAKPVEDTTAKVTLVINSDMVGTTSTNVKVGKQLKVSDNYLKKSGYTFAGWYLDAEFTKPYTVAPLESAEDFTLYAKWTSDSATPEGTTPPPTGTTGSDATVTPPTIGADNNGGNTTVIVICVVAAVVVLGGGAAAVIVLKKKK